MSDLHGSRVGMMEFRDPNARMDSDLTGNGERGCIRKGCGKGKHLLIQRRERTRCRSMKPRWKKRMQVSKGTEGTG